MLASRKSIVAFAATAKGTERFRLVICPYWCPYWAVSSRFQFSEGAGYDQPHQREEVLVMPDFHSIEMQSITGEPVSLSKFQENLCLVVNVASR
jgi:hypothetical protein